jgi:hypothetical protein
MLNSNRIVDGFDLISTWLQPGDQSRHANLETV